MIYQWYETHRALMSPFAELASASSKLYTHPLSPLSHTPMAQRGWVVLSAISAAMWQPYSEALPSAV